MNHVLRIILEAVRDQKVTPNCRTLAARLLDKEDRREAAAAARACSTAKVAKKAVASVEHHKKARRAEERILEKVADATWIACCGRSRIDHRGMLACEACHRLALTTLTVEPHHLVLGSRTDAPELVMALCRDCHTLDPKSAHRSPRHFAQTIVIPWAKAHGYPLPNRKEYRE